MTSPGSPCSTSTRAIGSDEALAGSELLQGEDRYRVHVTAGVVPDGCFFRSDGATPSLGQKPGDIEDAQNPFAAPYPRFEGAARSSPTTDAEIDLPSARRGTH